MAELTWSIKIYSKKKMHTRENLQSIPQIPGLHKSRPTELKFTDSRAVSKSIKKEMLSPYIIFCSEKRPELRAAHPNATFGEMGKMLGQIWAQMDESAQAAYGRIIASNILPHSSTSANSALTPASNSASNGTSSPSTASNPKPTSKRTPSPYIIFCCEKRPELRAAHPNATFGEMGKMLGQMWAQMDESAQAAYARESTTRRAAENLSVMS